jgi:hypothetical protein
MNHTIPTLTALLLVPLASLNAADATSEAPRLLWPADKMEITDEASFFGWSPVTGCTNHEIQIARDDIFRDIRKTERTREVRYHEHLYFLREPLPAGTSAWHVRAVVSDGPSAWSETFHVRVNTNRTIAPTVVRQIRPCWPVFLMLDRAWDPRRNLQRLRETIPPGFESVIVVDYLRLAGPSAVRHRAGVS